MKTFKYILISISLFYKSFCVDKFKVDKFKEDYRNVKSNYKETELYRYLKSKQDKYEIILNEFEKQNQSLNKEIDEIVNLTGGDFDKVFFLAHYNEYRDLKENDDKNNLVKKIFDIINKRIDKSKENKYTFDFLKESFEKNSEKSFTLNKSIKEESNNTNRKYLQYLPFNLSLDQVFWIIKDKMIFGERCFIVEEMKKKGYTEEIVRDEIFYQNEEKKI